MLLLNKNKEITAAFAGEVFEAHKEGCAYVKEHAMFKCDHRFDVVIASNSGYPLDQNLYQTVKGMSAASKVVKEGGNIIMVSECADGFLIMVNSLKSLKWPTPHKGFWTSSMIQTLDQWQVQKQASIQTFANVYVYSINRSTIERFNVKSNFKYRTNATRIRRTIWT